MTFDVFAAATFGALLLWGCIADLRSRRISNRLVVLMALLGIGFAIARNGAMHGALNAAVAMLLGVAIWIPCYVLRMMGAGDVKFFGAAAAWIGPELTIGAALLAALFGGVLAVAWMIWLRFVREYPDDLLGWERLQSMEQGLAIERRKTLPYGVAMAAGLAMVSWFPDFLRWL